MTEDDKRPTITLATGVEVDARAAVALVDDLRALLSVNPEEFQTLHALAEGREGDADPRHFHSLRADFFLEKDGRTIRPVVREVLLACYEFTREGAVIVPLRLKDEASKGAAEHAQERLDRWQRDLLSGPGDPDDRGPSRG